MPQWLTLFVTPKTEPATLTLAVRILAHVLVNVHGIFGQPILYNFRYGYFVCIRALVPRPPSPLRHDHGIA